jgi:hypothetical protein
MKAAESPSRRRVVIAIGLTLASGAIGYGISRTSSGESPVLAAPSTPPPAEAPALSTESGSAVSARDQGDRKAYLAKLRDHLIMEIRSSPEIYLDYEMKRELHRQLAGLSAAELEALFNEPIEGKAQEIRELKNWILNAWVLKDAPAALHASGESCVHVFNAWGFHDRDAALTWLRDAELKGPLEGKRQQMRINLLIWVARIDFERAKQEWPYMDERERKSTLGAWTDSSDNFTGHRDALVEFVNQQLAGAGGKGLDPDMLQRLAAIDADAARQKVDAMDGSPAERAEMEVAILKATARKTPGEAFANWLAHHPADQDVPDSFWTALDQAHLFREEETIQWLDSLQPGHLRDAIHERGTRLLASRGNFEKAASYIEGIADPTMKTNATKILKAVWTNADPEKAEAWLKATGYPEGE